MKTIIFVLIAVCHLSQGNKLVPQTEKPGQCPNFDGAFGICGADPKEICVGDQDCQGALKCCSRPCGKTCTDAIQVSPPLPPRQNPGQCPPRSGSRGICTFDPKNNCLGDQDCTAYQKCCSDQCGKTCKSAIQVSPPRPPPPPPARLEQPGQCPPTSGFGICSFDPKNNCLSDQECGPNQKCCSDQCGKTCKTLNLIKTPGFRVPPPARSLERPGQCPAPSGSFGVCTFDPKNNCLADNECAPNQKCCSDQCGKTCKYSQQISPPGPPPPPIPARHPPLPARHLVKFGQCPASSSDSFKACVFDPTKNCLYDEECSDDLKCCSDGCGKICKRPE